MKITEYKWPLLIRLCLVCSVGYIHPDEFFQSPEVMAGQVFGIPAAVPWEFQAQNGILYRSYLPPFIVSGLPYYLLRSTGIDTSGIGLLIAPRIWLFIISLSMDFILRSIAHRLNLDTGTALFLFQTSWVTLLFSTRTFSNTLEMLALVLTLGIVVLKPRQWWTPWTLGVLVSFGCFVRITFPAFALPVGLWWFHHIYQWEKVAIDSRRKDATNCWNTWLGIITRVVVPIIKAIVGFLCWTCVNIAFDSIYLDCVTHGFTGLKGLLSRGMGNEIKIVFAPINNLVYNSIAENLELHGLHSRFNHAMVNMQMLFGPLAIISAIRAIIPSWRYRHSVLFLGMWLVPLISLSLFPHQEARFLIPLILPLVLANVPASVVSEGNVSSTTISDTRDSAAPQGSIRPSDANWKIPTRFRMTWLVFNFCLVVLFGVLHQGGVVSNVAMLNKLLERDNHTNAVCVAGTHIYMMPRFLLGTSAAKSNIELYDVGSDENLLYKHLMSPCVVQRTNTTGTWWVLAPNTVVERIKDDLRSRGVDSEAIEVLQSTTISPHLTMEQLPRSISELKSIGLVVLRGFKNKL